MHLADCLCFTILCSKCLKVNHITLSLSISYQKTLKKQNISFRFLMNTDGLNLCVVFQLILYYLMNKSGLCLHLAMIAVFVYVSLVS